MCDGELLSEVPKQHAKLQITQTALYHSPGLAAGGLGTLSWSDLDADAPVEWPGAATDDVAALLKKRRQGRPFRAAS